MGKIIWNTEVNAPCCPGEIINGDNEEETILVQIDYEFPSTAMTFGWNILDVQKDDGFCEHTGTDGSVDCPVCKITASTFIDKAGEWLDNNDGATVDDPGYFS